MIIAVAIFLFFVIVVCYFIGTDGVFNRWVTAHEFMKQNPWATILVATRYETIN